LSPTGRIALWTYTIPTFPNNPALSDILSRFYEYTRIQGWWDVGVREPIDDQYASLFFPWECIETPTFHSSSEWTAKEIIQYISTWSCFQRINDTTHVNRVSKEIESSWAKSNKKEDVLWTFHVRLGQRPYYCDQGQGVKGIEM
jgi:hypothetical protein